MLFRQLFDQTSWTYTYILASGKGREGIIIDPVLEHAAQYATVIEQLGLKLALVLDTHTHADHVTASGHLRNQLACKIAMGENTKAECVDIHLKPDETLDIDGLDFKALYTPGHTDDSFSFLMDDRVFTGDTLLIRRTGRTDFQNGDPAVQYDSLFKQLLKLPDDTLVYPAHDYDGMTVSTIAEEKAYNPRLQVKDKQAFVAMMNGLNLPYPKQIDRAVPANLKCGLAYT